MSRYPFRDERETSFEASLIFPQHSRNKTWALKAQSSGIVASQGELNQTFFAPNHLSHPLTSILREVNLRQGSPRQKESGLSTLYIKDPRKQKQEFFSLSLSGVFKIYKSDEIPGTLFVTASIGDYFNVWEVCS